MWILGLSEFLSLRVCLTSWENKNMDTYISFERLKKKGQILNFPHETLNTLRHTPALKNCINAFEIEFEWNIRIFSILTQRFLLLKSYREKIFEQISQREKRIIFSDRGETTNNVVVTFTLCRWIHSGKKLVVFFFNVEPILFFLTLTHTDIPCTVYREQRRMCSSTVDRMMCEKSQDAYIYSEFEDCCWWREIEAGGCRKTLEIVLEFEFPRLSSTLQ